jgi:hypothetical protein
VHVYIDESGSFSIPKRARRPSVSCVGALTIPTAQHDEIIAEFRELSRTWPNDRGEIKGRLLREEHFDAALALYASRGILLEAVAIDLGTHDTTAILQHKLGAAANILKNVSNRMHPRLQQELKAMTSTMHAISVPEYVQMVVTTTAIESVFRTNFRWLPLTAPSELSSFAWIIDGKELTPTKMERLWSKICLPWLQSRSLNNPLVTITEGDFSYLPADVVRELPGAPTHLAPHIRQPAQPFEYFEIKTILRSPTFANSANHVGLQMADLAISAVRRAMMGNLGDFGWERLGSLLIRRSDSRADVVTMLEIGEPPRRWVSRPHYYDVLRTLWGTALPSLPPDA